MSSSNHNKWPCYWLMYVLYHVILMWTSTVWRGLVAEWCVRLTISHYVASASVHCGYHIIFKLLFLVWFSFIQMKSLLCNSVFSDVYLSWNAEQYVYLSWLFSQYRYITLFYKESLSIWNGVPTMSKSHNILFHRIYCEHYTAHDCIWKDFFWFAFESFHTHFSG